MHFTTAFSILAFVGSAIAQTAGFDAISKPTKGEQIPAGSSYTIEWQPTAQYDGAVTITLMGGATPSTLDDVDVLAASVQNSAGSFVWSVGADLGTDATYGLRINWIKDPTIFQYSFPFAIEAGSGANSSTSGSATGSATGSVSGSVSRSATPSATASATGSASASSNDTVTSTASSQQSSVTKPSITGTTQGSNQTTTRGASNTIVTVTTTQGGSSATTSSSPSAVASNKAGTVAASSLALVGGLAMAIFAL